MFSSFRNDKEHCVCKVLSLKTILLELCAIAQTFHDCLQEMITIDMSQSVDNHKIRIVHMGYIVRSGTTWPECRVPIFPY